MTPTYPPGPALPPFVQSFLYLNRRARWLPVLRRRHGDVFAMRVPPFNDNVVVFHRPEHVKEIFAGDPRDMHAGEANNILRPIMGSHSVLLTDESEHARARKLLMPAFNGAALRGYEKLVEQIAEAETQRWQPDSTLVTLDRMNALTLEVIMRVVFGVTDPGTRAALAPRLHRVVTIGPVQYAGLQFPRLQRLRPWKTFHDNLDAIDALLYREIAARRAVPDLAERTDVLSRLLQVGGDDERPLSDAELRDQLVTLLLAGHETTAAALSWALYELAADQRIQLRTYDAVRSGDDKFVEAVLKEAMRLHPVIPGAVRRLTHDTTVGGYALPAGTTVSCSIMLAHGSDANYPDVAAFRPSRFLDGEVGPNMWLPFGGGVRRCIGAGFSLMEGTAVLRTVLSRFALARPSGAKPERGHVRNITTVPRGKARIVITKRGP
ncbi:MULTISPECIES: cytochrome P450 [unclassified Nocardia]|uniref:cytochrome P450 n=1 Tax=unclassified Nocardia TaxID=2637762 RepID=UPI001CE3D06C|nr:MULTISPECIES: cytochrome P450 [unclassified Nocardia]